jgi:hypothetical protein
LERFAIKNEGTEQHDKNHKSVLNDTENFALNFPQKSWFNLIKI